MQTSLCIWTVKIENRLNPGDVRSGDSVTGVNISKNVYQSLGLCRLENARDLFVLESVFHF